MFVDALLMDVLRPALGLPAGRVGTMQRADLMANLPFVVARSVSAVPVDARFADRHSVQVDTFANSATAAHALAAQARAAMMAAYTAQTIYPSGWLSYFDVTAGATEFREDDQPTDFARFIATYTVVAHI